MKWYIGIGPERGEVVPEEEAYEYAMERCFGTEEEKEEFKKMLVEWFYSGNWITAE